MKTLSEEKALEMVMKLGRMNLVGKILSKTQFKETEWRGDV